MKVRVNWLEGMTFVGESGSGHAVVMDGPPDLGGRNLGPRPMEMLLLGMGSCSAVDVVEILKKSRQQVSHCVVEIDAQRAEEIPKVFTHIHLHFIISGQNLGEKQVQRAVNLSAEKYCSATRMLAQVAEVKYSVEIRQSNG